MKRMGAPVSGSSKRLCCEEEPRSVGITDLPEEMLVAIFSRLTAEQLAASAAPVCGLWQDLAHREVLCRTLAFRGLVVNTPQLIKYLREAPELESLELINRKDLSEILTEIPKHNSGLQRLSIEHCWGSANEFSIPKGSFVRLISDCKELTELTVKWSAFDAAVAAADITSALPGLRKVYFKNTDLARVSLTELAQGCPKLEEIRLVPSGSYSDISMDKDISKVSSCLCGTLKVLEIIVHEVTEGSATALATCKKLHTLELECDLILGQLQRFTALTGLTSLKLSGASDTTSMGWQRFFSDVAWRGRLRSVGLSFCTGVDDAVLSAIGASFSCLEEADFSFCSEVTEEGVGNVIRGCRKLRVLKLLYTQSCVALSFSLIPQHCPGLRTLVFCRKDTEKEMPDWTQLQKQLPYLKIYTSKP